MSARRLVLAEPLGRPSSGLSALLARLGEAVHAMKIIGAV